MTLEEENKTLKEENKKLKKELERLKKEFDNTKREFEEFKAKHITTVFELRKALKIKPNNKSIPAFGAPKGHIGYARHVPELIDKIKSLNPKRCPHCNTKLGGYTGDTLQIFD
jgi:hypothetical protein